MADGPRVLMVVTFLDDAGGVQKQAWLQARALRDLGCDVQFLAARIGKHAAEEDVDGIVVHRLPFLDGWRLGNIKFALLNRHIKRWMRRHADSFDIVHVHQALWTACGAAKAAQKLGKPCVVKIGNTGSRADLRVLRQGLFTGGHLVRGLIKRPDCFIVTSRRAGKELKEAGIAEERIVHIPNGVQLPAHLVGPDAEARRTLGVKDCECLFLHVSSLVLHKRPMLSLIGFLAASREYPDARLWFLGGGVLAGWLDRQFRQLQTGNRVCRHGAIKDVSAYLRAADAFVLPSAVEGMSNALLEAMAHGLPCIASRVSGSEDLIEDGVNGFLVPVDDVKELAGAFRRLMDDPVLRRDMGTAARRTIEQSYTIDRIAQRIRALYDEII